MKSSSLDHENGSHDERREAIHPGPQVRSLLNGGTKIACFCLSRVRSWGVALPAFLSSHDAIARWMAFADDRASLSLKVPSATAILIGSVGVDIQFSIYSTSD
jgi:hypothetical protein